MRTIFAAAFLSLLSTSALAAAAADPAAPLGRLSDAARPTAYTLDLTIVPDQPRFSGHVEIAVALKGQTQHLYMHGRDLHVTKAVAMVGDRAVPATWTQVEQTGVVRLDFATPVPAGAATLVFDYDGAFGDNPSGLYRIQVGGKWYSWTQFESIDARAAFPSFDEPGFKTPFTVSITTTPGLKTVSNAPETGVTKVGTMEKHSFQPTRPLPTYLVALMTGPFVTKDGQVGPTPQRAAPLPLRVVASQPQADKLDYALAESQPIVSLLEKYFGQPFPFPKLDQIGSPVMPGAMENAGADTYADFLLFLDKNAPTRQRQYFGMVVSHELSHQWFGDLVSPAWWDDIWLNESFANWMGYRIGNEWRPELNIGVGAIDEALGVMNTDSLTVGRPIHQHIERNGQIDSAFDGITYGKGGQVIAMIAAYLGDEKFRDGVRLHLSRHMYGNASSEQFFQALADAAKDPRVLAAMKSFVDQQGVPVVTLHRQGGSLTATQARWTFLGQQPGSQQWVIPFCLRAGAERSCTLIDGRTATIRTSAGTLVPNAGGTGYYRYELDPADWQTLIAAGATLPAGDALAAEDSMWASFRAGHAPFASVLAMTRAMAANKDSNVAVDGGQRLAGFKSRGLIPATADADYRHVIGAVYAPKLAAMGFDPALGAHAADEPDRQKTRGDLVTLVAMEAHDPAVTAKLEAAGTAYLDGDAKAVDPSFLTDALTLVVQKGGLSTAKSVMEKALASEDPIFRGSAINAVAASDRPEVATWLLGFKDQRLRSLERLQLLYGLSAAPRTRDMANEWVLANYDAIAAGGNGIFITSKLPGMFGNQCSVEKATAVEQQLGPKVMALGQGELDFARTVEGIRHCADLKVAKSAEIAAALKGA